MEQSPETKVARAERLIAEGKKIAEVMKSTGLGRTKVYEIKRAMKRRRTE